MSDRGSHLTPQEHAQRVLTAWSTLRDLPGHADPQVADEELGNLIASQIVAAQQSAVNALAERQERVWEERTTGWLEPPEYEGRLVASLLELRNSMDAAIKGGDAWASHTRDWPPSQL